MWSQRLWLAAPVVLVLVFVVSGLRDALHKAASPSTSTPIPTATTAPTTPTSTETNLVASTARCGHADMKLAVELRRASHRQDTGAFTARSHHRVATIVLRNVSHHGCIGGAAFDFRILDRKGRLVGWWDTTDDPKWFVGYYKPGAYHTLSLPTVYRCDRPGPFTAVALVGPYTVLRHGLSHREITC